MTTVEDLLAVARGQLGVAINTPGVPYATTFSCAKFTSWVYEQVGLGQYADESPSVQMGIFQSDGRFDTTPHPGDQVFIDLTGQGMQAFHTGFVDTVAPDGSTGTIEFNAPDAGPNVVKRHTRSAVGDGFTLGYGHPAYTADQPTPAPTPRGRLYLGIGHGLEPNGVLDQGAHNDTDGTNEHDLNTRVCRVADAALTRCGIGHYAEQNSGASHDPDYRGSVTNVNEGSYDLAIEVHFDTAAAPPGGFGIYLSDDGRRLADAIRNHWGQAGLPQRANYVDQRGLWFLKGTDCPAVIWECDPTAAHDDGQISRMGEAIAAGVCDYYGVAYVAATTNPTPPPPVVIDFPGDHMQLVKITVAGLVDGKQVSTDAQGNGSTLLTGTAADHVVNAYPNTAGYVPLPRFVGCQDEGGHARLEWVGPPLAPPFEAHIWVAE